MKLLKFSKDELETESEFVYINAENIVRISIDHTVCRLHMADGTCHLSKLSEESLLNFLNS